MKNLEEMSYDELVQYANKKFKGLKGESPDEKWWKDPEWATYSKELIEHLNQQDVFEEFLTEHEDEIVEIAKKSSYKDDEGKWHLRKEADENRDRMDGILISVAMDDKRFAGSSPRELTSTLKITAKDIDITDSFIKNFLKISNKLDDLEKKDKTQYKELKDKILQLVK